jgi:hypothetical protein
MEVIMDNSIVFVISFGLFLLGLGLSIILLMEEITLRKILILTDQMERDATDVLARVRSHD